MQGYVVKGTWRSTAALVSLVFCVLSWELTGAMFVGRWLFGPLWFGPHREWFALGVGVGLSAYHLLWGRRLLQKHYRVGDASDKSLTVLQVVAVAVLLVAAGAFGTWLFVHGRA